MLSFDQSDDELVAELAQHVAIPSVSRDADAVTMLSAAQWLADRLTFANGRIEETDGHPVVRGEWLGRPDAPTVLVYGHYDVQPAGDLTAWTTPPFELTRDGDIVRGRGASDDKGPVFVVLKTAEAFIAQEGGLPLNVKFLFEGEEEIGSPSLGNWLAAHSEELAADLVISADGAMWRAGEPSLSVASKGLVSLDLEVTGANRDLHSGRYGGTVANPAAVLAQILASLHGPDGEVSVSGFSDGVAPLSRQRREEISAVAWDDVAYGAELGVPDLYGEGGYSTLERLWTRPTLEINGLTAGGKYTVIPARAVAHISCRLVPGQDPDRVLDAVVAHLLSQPAPGVWVEAHVDPARVPAYTIAADHPAIRSASAALASVYPNQEVLLAVIAGSLPAATLFEVTLGLKTLFFSFSTSDERLHAPDEFIRVRRIREGMRAWAGLWRLLADGPHRLSPGPSPAASRTDP
jgi:acetylornithine deacetylase/succinyl-diaminopimelate desuccinylase-like protein